MRRAVLILALLAAGRDPASAGEARLAGRFRVGQELPGRVARAVFDTERERTYVATRTILYELREQELLEIEKRQQSGARLVAAPGGFVYAWLLPHPTVRGFYAAELRSLPPGASPPQRLDRDGSPAAVSELHLGHQGKLILTATPLSNPEGLGGTFAYIFWNAAGGIRRRIDLPGPRRIILDPEGEAALLLGPDDVAVCSPAGTMLVPPVPGRFRNGAVAAGGGLVLLNPAETEATRQVHVLKVPAPGEPPAISIVQVPRAVNHIRIAPDRSSAVLTGRSGRYSLLDITTNELRPGLALPVDGIFGISDVGYVDVNRLVFGIIRRTGGAPEGPWNEGALLVMSPNGPEPFRVDFTISRPVSSVPAVETAFDRPTFIGYTEDEAVLVQYQ